MFAAVLIQRKLLTLENLITVTVKESGVVPYIISKLDGCHNLMIIVIIIHQSWMVVNIKIILKVHLEETVMISKLSSSDDCCQRHHQ